MSQTVLSELFASFGGDVTTSGPTNANRGFTARQVTMPDEGFSTNKDMEMIDGFSAPGRSDAQTLTLPFVNVSEDSPGPVVLSIRPSKRGALANLYRQKTSTSGSGDLQSLNYTADPNDNDSEADSIDVDRSSLLLSQVTLGSKIGLLVTGKVTVYQTGAKGLRQTTSGTAISGKPTTYGSNAGATGSTVEALTADADGAIYGYWEAETTIQSVMTDYGMMVLKAASAVLGDDVLQTLDGKAVKFSEMEGIASGGLFLNDFLISSSKYQIVKSFTSKNIYFPPQTSVPEGTIVSFGEFVPGTNGNLAIGESNNNTTCDRYIQYSYNNYPKLNLSFFEGSKIDVPVTLYDGCSIPAGMVAASGTTVDDKDGTIITTNLVLSDVRAPIGTLLPGEVDLVGVVLEGDRASIKAGMSSAQLQNLPLGSKTTKAQVLNGAVFPASSSLPSDLTLLTTTELSVPVVGTKGTLVKAGSVLPKGAITLEDAVIRDGFVIVIGSTVSDEFNVSTPFVVTDSATSGVALGAGATLKAPFIFPPSTQITDDNVLPAPFKVLMSMGTTLSAAMEIAAGSFFGAAATLYGDVKFSPTGLIPALSTLHGSFVLPTATKLEKDTLMNVSVPVPPGSKFHTGDTLFTGTSIREGTPLPLFQNGADQAGPAYVSGDAVGPLTKFTEGGILYLVVKARTTFMAGSFLPVGSILSKKSTPGHTGSLGTDVDNGANQGSASDYTINAGEYSTDTRDKSPAAQDFTFVAGEATTQLVQTLTDINFDSDMVIPVDLMDPDFTAFLALQEPFTLVADLVLTEDYFVRGNKAVMWPAGHPLPFDFVFSGPFNFTTPNSGTPLNKDIQFNVRTSDEFFGGVLTTSDSYIKLPYKGYRLVTPIKLGVDQPVASTGTHALKSTVELAKGTKLSTTAGFITTQQPMQVDGDFVLGADITNFPRIFLPKGIRLLAGQVTPGEIQVGAGQGLPKNVTLSQSVTLAADHIISETTYTFPMYTVLAAQSTLARRTNFPSGLTLEDMVKIGPFLSLGSSNIFMVNEENRFTGDIEYPYVVDVNGVMQFPRLDARGLIVDFENLQAVVQALQAQFGNA